MANKDSTIIELKNVSVHYDNNSGHEGVDALRNVNISIKKGELVFIVGESGAGKSTLLKLLHKEIEPTEGRIFVDGQNLAKIKKRQKPYYKRKIGMIYQDFRLIPKMTVYDNVAFVMRITDKSKREIRKRVPDVLNLVKLNDKYKSYPDELSGGEKQRTAIARAFANNPPIIIADEPTANIDPELSFGILEMLEEINDNGNGATVIIVTHEHSFVQYLGGRVIKIEKGAITHDGYVPSERGALNR